MRGFRSWGKESILTIGIRPTLSLAERFEMYPFLPSDGMYNASWRNRPSHRHIASNRLSGVVSRGTELVIGLENVCSRIVTVAASLLFADQPGDLVRKGAATFSHSRGSRTSIPESLSEHQRVFYPSAVRY